MYAKAWLFSESIKILEINFPKKWNAFKMFIMCLLHSMILNFTFQILQFEETWSQNPWVYQASILTINSQGDMEQKNKETSNKLILMKASVKKNSV